MTETPETCPDRLSSLMARFTLSVSPAPVGTGNLIVLATQDGTADHALLCLRGKALHSGERAPLLSARVDWGGVANPLASALPDPVRVDLRQDAEGATLIRLLQAEITGPRCGSASVIARLTEVLIVRMLRDCIASGSATPGLLAGLADPRLSRAIVAIHDQPEKTWLNDDLAVIAGLSLSRFADLFTVTMGETPGAYARRWRLLLARQDLARGQRVERVAHRYGYGSAEGFSRAYRQHFGTAPIAERKRHSA
ncbi:transcriptional regulator, AraC family [Gemmobacter caeni]|uniref:AraC family transcriptional regulator n=1 Tax=Gemmobacter caeni TaxID=589035 RepID=A0A2T6B4C9_9RHOB|nr:AraC family transcriptional regulator [Gemmobacter caeni]PTX50936.1 AraC family transcriptional regulator [Gemmobacter caeni]TWI89929.1 transcriptional regulator, AraC family [Gemmobacter caeni]